MHPCQPTLQMVLEVCTIVVSWSESLLPSLIIRVVPLQLLITQALSQWSLFHATAQKRCCSRDPSVPPDGESPLSSLKSTFCHQSEGIFAMTPSTSASSSDFQHRHAPKRMRLGTKSCAECRRRRVRCAFPPDGRACEACSLHGVECMPQKPTSQRKGAQQQYDPEKAELRRRLASLEAMVRHISTTVNLDPETTAWAQLQTESERQKRLQHPSAAALGVDPVVVSSTTEEGSIKWSKTDQQSDSSDELDQFEDAPLVNLFKDALKIERPPPNSKDRPQQTFRTDYRIKAAIEDVAPILPTLDDLRLVLEASERFWCIWPMRPPGQGATAGAPRILSAQNFIVDSLNSGRPLIIAKALLWLTLCMHQLPRDFACQGSELRNSRGNIIRHFLNAADTLLSIEGEAGARGQGKDLLECLQLQMRISIDMGKPRKAWLTNRRAMNTALLLGFQNRGTATTTTTTTDEQNIIWRQLWHIDRMLSVVLGLPCAISDSHPSLAKEYAGPTIESQLMHDLAIIAGRIVDRNMNHKTVNYSVTMDIDQDLERCKTRMPSSWWNPEFDTTLPFELAHGRQTIKLFYFSVCKTLHMPYMFKTKSSGSSSSSSSSTSSDKMYELSRMAALEACRDCIRVYKGMRDNHTGDVPVICDLMDFLAFSATITLVVDLLSTSTSSSSSSSKRPAAAAAAADGGGVILPEEKQDWELVNSVSAVLNDVANKLSCSVAGQGSNLLERLIKARHGQYDDAEPFEAVVPYFGKVRIGTVTKSVRGVKSTHLRTQMQNSPRVSSGPGGVPTMTMSDQSQSNQSQPFLRPTLDPSPSSMSQPQSASMSLSMSSPSTLSSPQDHQTSSITTTNTVEFNLGGTTSFGQCCSVEGGGWILSDDELTMDWESFVHVNTSYDWSQFFESAMPD